MTSIENVENTIMTDIGAINNEHGYDCRTDCNKSNNLKKGPFKDIYASKEMKRFMMT